MRAIILSTMLLLAAVLAAAADRHNFSFRGDDFLLDGKPFQLIGGEIHPARIPSQYWRHRIQMVKAMGCNTIAAYIFWSFHETSEGVFDFSTPERGLARFLRIAQEEGMWVLLRPGPYSCGEWDFGGIPAYLLRHPDLRIRCLDPRFMAPVERYMRALAKVVKPLQITEGGPILMVQIENEYGSYGNDRAYLERLRTIWQQSGITVPFYTSDGASVPMLEAGTLPGAAVGLDPGAKLEQFELARKMNPGVPVFSSESYPGWLTHWGKPWARRDVGKLIREMRPLLDKRLSISLYMAHGGTNFGYAAGANAYGNGYVADVTSYDLDAPINEQGRPNAKFYALRSLFKNYRAANDPLPEIPAPIPAAAIQPIEMQPYASIWENLPNPISSVQPNPMESYGQDYGLIAYQTTLVGQKSGALLVTETHDYATVFLDDRYIGKLDRVAGIHTLTLPAVENPKPVLTILVEAMGRINYSRTMIDRKGITDHVSLNGMTLMNWRVYPLPLKEEFIGKLPAGKPGQRPGIFFRGTFEVAQPADTYLDMTAYSKGIVWVNGRNLGRYWDLGPQRRLYCPGAWLRRGSNDIVVFDLHQVESYAIPGFPTLE
jgi:beta-galactosidase